MSRRTQVPDKALLDFVYGAITLFGRPFQARSTIFPSPMLLALQPHQSKLQWFGLIRVRSPLLAESRLIYFPEGTEMFHFPSLATLSLCIQQRVTQT